MNTSADLLKELRIDRSAPPPAPPRRGLWIGLAIAAVVLLALAVAAWWWLGRARAPEVQVATVTAIGGNGPATVLDASGYVVARRMATVSAKITGRVREVRIEEGQQVAAGEVLATLDPIDADAQRQLAAAQLGAAESQIGSVRAQLAQAEADARRYAVLVDQQLISRSQYDQAIAQRDNLRAQLAVATRNTDVSRDALKIADIGVDNTIVRAPFAGVIIAKAAQPGEIVSPLSAGGGFTRTGIGTIVDMDSLEVEVDVGEAFIGRVEPGMPVLTTLNSYPDWKIPGKVIAIIPTADRGKATVKVRISLGVKDPRIVPDMGVRVSFLEAAAPSPAERHGVLAPAAALVDRAGQPVAFVVDGEHVRERKLTLGRTLGDDREVTAGLAAGDQVVLDPSADLADGSAVRIAAAAAADGDDGDAADAAP
jgi:RND family efflux transporter MFP subunit